MKLSVSVVEPKCILGPPLGASISTPKEFITLSLLPVISPLALILLEAVTGGIKLTPVCFI